MGTGRHLRSGRVAWSAITVRLRRPPYGHSNIDLAGIIKVAGGVLTGIAKPRMTTGAFAFKPAVLAQPFQGCDELAGEVESFSR